jgi:hypothetical protein
MVSQSEPLPGGGPPISGSMSGPLPLPLAPPLWKSSGRQPSKPSGATAARKCSRIIITTIAMAKVKCNAQENHHQYEVGHEHDTVEANCGLCPPCHVSCQMPIGIAVAPAPAPAVQLVPWTLKRYLSVVVWLGIQQLPLALNFSNIHCLKTSLTKHYRAPYLGGTLLLTWECIVCVAQLKKEARI